MIINLLALLVILAAGAVAGILFTLRYADHRHARLQAARNRLADRELLAPWPAVEDHAPRRRGPSAVDSRDRLPI